MQNSNIEKIVEETINSFDGAERATAKPFLLTRIYARLQNQSSPQDIWARIGSVIASPRVAFASIILILILNAAIFWKRSNADKNTVVNTSLGKDDFAINVISIYDFENQEP